MMTAKKFVALARVSSREQEREGFSLDVQEEALHRYSEREGGVVAKLFRIAETASKCDERKTFKAMLSYVRQNAAEVSALLFYKVDRAARNLFDYVELERLEDDTGVPVVYVTQPTENTPAGRMMRRTLANMATFYTEQQSLDVREGMARRVEKEGLFPYKAPYGYRNIRVNDRALVEVDSSRADFVRRAFGGYAFESHTLDSLSEALYDEGYRYSESRARIPRSKLHSLLRNRAYIGEVHFRDTWHRGSHEALVDKATFDRVQVLLGEKTYASHSAVFGAGMVKCGHCGHPIVVEVKHRKLKSGEVREYRYYRCARYNLKGHPRDRINETDLDEQVLELFDTLRIKDEAVRKWIVKILHARVRDRQGADEERLTDIKRQLTEIKRQKDRLLNLRLMDEIEGDTYTKKHAELKREEAHVELLLQARGRQQSEHADLAVKTFELSQALVDKWDTADIGEKRTILGIICLNWTLDGVTLVPTMRKPFDVLAEGLLKTDGRGDWI